MILRPSLKRRLVCTLFIGMLLTWGMLLAKDFLEYKHKIKHQLSQGQLNQSLLMSMERLQPAQVEAAIAHTHATFEQLSAWSTPPAKGPVYFQWRHLVSGQVYASHRSVALPTVPPPNGQTSQIEGRPYWPVTQASAHWRLTIWHPAMDDTHAAATIGLDLLSYIAWAFPVLGLLLMVAAWQGLKPLSRLTDEVQHRAPNDFTALHDPTGYAELAPILSAFNDLLARVRMQHEHNKQLYETVAHELKTPLAIIAGHAHVIATNTAQAVRLQSLQVLEKTVEGLSTHIHQLIRLSSLSNPSASPLAQVDLVSLVQDLLIDFMPLAQGRQMDMTLDAPDQLPAQVSESAVELVMKNLLKNAITHGTVGGRVEVRLSQTGNTWAVEVADDGPGLAARPISGEQGAPSGVDAANTSCAHVHFGSGLGLTIVAQAVEVLKGQLSLSQGLDGKGLAARVVAPCSPPLT